MTMLKIYHGAEKPMIAVGKHQVALLGFAERFPGWHTMGKDRCDIRAMQALERKGYLEVIGDQFRLTYPKS